MKVGIFVPYSWSFIGGVVEHAEYQAAALRDIGVDARLYMGLDPPGGVFGRVQRRAPRPDEPPPGLVSIGRSVIVRANDSEANIVMDPRSVGRMRRLLEAERFDVVHVHEPMTPIIGLAALTFATTPIVATWHTTGDLKLLRVSMAMWGFLATRIDRNIAVSQEATTSALRCANVECEIVPNGVPIPPGADPGGRDHNVVFIGRLDPRKGLDILLSAWPEVHRKTGARLRLIGVDPAAARPLLARAGVPARDVDLLGIVVGEPLTQELRRAKLLVAPSLGGESFGMVLTRAFASATPVVASDIPGYRDVMTDDVGILVPPGDRTALATAVSDLLADEPRRSAAGGAAHRHAVERYGWPDIARRLASIYEDLIAARQRSRLD